MTKETEIPTANIPQQASVQPKDAETNEIKPLHITEDDKDRFLECIATGEAFSYSFGADTKFPFTVRDKTVKENNIITRSLDKLMAKGKILNWTEYANAYNACSCYYQVVEINGVAQPKVYPTAKNEDSFNVVNEFNESLLGQFSSSQFFIVMMQVSRFNKCILDLSAEIVTDPNF